MRNYEEGLFFRKNELKKLIGKELGNEFNEVGNVLKDFEVEVNGNEYEINIKLNESNENTERVYFLNFNGEMVYNVNHEFDIDDMDEMEHNEGVVGYRVEEVKIEKDKIVYLVSEIVESGEGKKRLITNENIY